MAQPPHAVTHVMVDIETLGTLPGSAILSIGAIAFDPFTETLSETFEARISLESCFAIGLTADPNTVLWWMKQGDEARSAAFLSGEARNVVNVLAQFADYLGAVTGHGLIATPSNLRLWAHGASFDPILLEAAYRAAGHEVPWQFRDVRDTRTIFDLAGIASLSDYRCANDVHHSALSDAKVQARAVGDAYRLLGIKAAR